MPRRGSSWLPSHQVDEYRDRAAGDLAVLETLGHRAGPEIQRHPSVEDEGAQAGRLGNLVDALAEEMDHRVVLAETPTARDNQEEREVVRLREGVQRGEQVAQAVVL